MKFSEAIREGARLSRQAFGSLYDRGGACAIGAACDWFEYTHGKSISCGVDYLNEFPVANIVVRSFPCGCSPTRYRQHVDGVAAHLNDDHKWSREAIAEWVETIEKKLETEQATPTAGGEANGESMACNVGSEVHCTPAEVTQ